MHESFLLGNKFLEALNLRLGEGHLLLRGLLETFVKVVRRLLLWRQNVTAQRGLSSRVLGGPLLAAVGVSDVVLVQMKGFAGGTVVEIVVGCRVTHLLD